MSGDHHDTAKSGHPWGEGEYLRLVDELRQGTPIEDIAVLLQRSPAAVRSRFRWLIPADKQTDLKASDREPWLRSALNSPDSDYDWRAALTENYAADGWRFWSVADETTLHEAWHNGRPLPTLAEEFGASEVQVAAQLCRSGLAASFSDVINRLGATPGGVAEIRARMAADRAAASVWVLVADGIGSRVVAFNQQRRHVSIHASYEEAEGHLDELVRDAAERGRGPVHWSIARRTLGEDTTGEATHDIALTDSASS